MPSTMDVKRLISEVRQRPVLWDMTKARYTAPVKWMEVAEALGANVEDCKRKWKNLRDTFHGEVRRFARRKKRDKSLGVYDPKISYKSKWAFYDDLEFIKESKRRQKVAADDNTVDEEGANNTMEQPSTSLDEPQPSTTEVKIKEDVDEDTTAYELGIDDDDETANDMLFEEFQNIATPQAARRLSATLSLTNSLEQNLSNDMPEQHISNDTPRLDNGVKQEKCRCPSSNSRNEDRVHFLEDLEKEEQKLIQSTKRDISRAQDHIGDSDYNFLVSFMPHMKKMSDLQNLQFRGRMCDLVLSILAPTMAAAPNAPALPTLTQAPFMAQGENYPNVMFN
uniref:MADF domain-containing protein n=1 Tax=Stomoxys calcitrans TaxID=35570 RepID=A0A1I8NX12_STOCA